MSNWASHVSGSQNAWKRIKNVNGVSRLSNFWIFFRRDPNDWWSWTKPGYIIMSRRQSNNQWSGSIAAQPAPPQKIPSAKIRSKSSRLDFLGSRPPHWLSSKGPNYQRGVLLISAGATEGYFEGKTPAAERSARGLVLARQCPGSPGTCNPEETGLPGLPMSLSSALFSGSGPVGLPPVPWTEKNNWKVVIFRPTRRSLLPRDLVGRTTWFFLSGFQKSKQRAKKCTELRG